MRKKLLKRILIVTGILILFGFIGLEILRQVGLRRGVEIVELPLGSEIRRLSTNADYSDAYRYPFPKTIPFEQVVTNSREMGTKIFEGDNEVVYRGTAPGLHFFVSFSLDRKQGTHLILSTVVFYDSTLGRLYFMPVKQVHKRGLPYFLIRHVNYYEQGN